MSVGTILLAVLLVVMLGGFVPWGAAPNGPYPNRAHFYGLGYGGGIGLGTVLVIVLILALLGRV